jgi:hypothetical protein
VPVFATGIFLLHPTPQRITVAVVIGAAAAGLIELAARVRAKRVSATRREREPA